MGTGVTPKRIATKNSLLSYLTYYPLMRYTSSVSYAHALHIFGLNHLAATLLTGVKPSYVRPSASENSLKQACSFSLHRSDAFAP